MLLIKRNREMEGGWKAGGQRENKREREKERENRKRPYCGN